MPVKNASAHLEACLHSIVQQTYRNWELIAVDDHSTDKSKEILQAWSIKEPRIRFYDHEGHGIIPALQHAFSKSSGHYIHRMDSDDWMMPMKLELLFLAVSDAELSTGKVKYFSSQLGAGYRKYEQWINDRTSENFWSDIYYECVLPSPCWMMKRALFEEYIFHPELQYPEDYFLAFFLYSKKIKVRASEKYLHLWRDHSERASRNDVNYQDQSFLPLKLNFFLSLNYDPLRTLMLWGAGKKGKTLAKMLIDSKTPFTWITNNPNKLGVPIYEKKLIHVNEMAFDEQKQQVLLALSNPQQKKDSIRFLESVSFNKDHNLFSFY